jgi:hypothetical protein
VSTSLGLAPPAATASIEAHADWLELSALVSPRRTVSAEELISAVRATGSTEALAEEAEVDRGSEQAQLLAENALSLTDERAVCCQKRHRYPYTFIGQSLCARSGAIRSTYAYLLLLSHYGEDAGPTDISGASLFEEVAAVAARNYLGGDRSGARAYSFGFPRRLTPRGFRPAVDDMCAWMGEGGGAKSKPSTAQQKDAKLDLVVCVPMPDGRTSKILGFGQCATGRNWRNKVSELQADAWCRKWLIDQPPVAPLRLFFLPHRIAGSDWDDRAHDAGIIFDRCRLAAHASLLPAELRRQVMSWSRHVFRERLAA